MRIALFVLVSVHGLIHVLGFVKAFGFKEIKELTLPISRPMGVLWLLGATLFVVYGALYLASHKYSWAFGLLAVLISQTLVVVFWSDARWGTLPNVVVLLTAITAFGQYNFNKQVHYEATNVIRQNLPTPEAVLTAADIKNVPEPVKKWLQNSGAVGRPYSRVGRVVQKAQMQLKPEQEKWMPATAIQYTGIDTPAFVWSVALQWNSFLTMLGRDTFKDGKGHMYITMNTLIKVADEKGARLNESTMQRYLGEMAWFPSLALSPYISWEQVNDTTATATMNYKGTTASGTFYFSPQGDFNAFSAQRYKDPSTDAQKHEWVLDVKGYTTFQGIKVPSKMTATWKLDTGDWTWLELEIVDIRYNDTFYPGDM